MRLIPWSAVAMTLVGCISVERLAALTDPCRQHLSLADRWAIAKCLPSDLRLSDEIGYDNFAMKQVYLSEKLAEVGARVSPDGKICDKMGKEIYFYLTPKLPGMQMNPAAYQRIIDQNAEEYRELQEKYHVIEIDKGWRLKPC
jgi:hypothetical protein